jgi:hypothetical protein
MDERTATQIAMGIEERYPDARAVNAGEEPVFYVYWTDGVGGEVHSFLLGEEEERFGVDVYRGDRMTDHDALFLSTYGFDDLSVGQVITELRSTPSDQK